MILSDDGRVHTKGTMPEILADFTGAIKAVYELLIDEGYDDDFARKSIANAGRLAFMSDKELKEQAENADERIRELLND